MMTWPWAHALTNIELREQRVRQEAALQEREDLSRSIFNTSMDGIFLLAPSGKVTMANPAHRMFDHAEGDLAHRDVRDLIHPDERRFVEHFREQLQDTGRVYAESKNVRRDGTSFHVEVRASRFFHRGEPRLLSIIRDVTEKREAFERLEKLNQLQEALLVSGNMTAKAKRITDTVVDLFDAAFARIWLIDHGDLCDAGCVHASVTQGPHVCRDRDRCLHLVASSGIYTHTNGRMHRRVPFGSYKIGRVAADEEPGFLTNDVAHDPRVHDHSWAEKLGLPSLAG